MICVDYTVRPSLIEGAGSGLFVTQPVNAGRVLIAPSHIHNTVSLTELVSHPNHPDADSSIRWFEDHCTVSPDWPDECYVNHSFSPTGLWHLGFVFTLRDLTKDEEITVDYRFLLGTGVELGFVDSETRQPIVGLSWDENLLLSTRALAQLATKNYGHQSAREAPRARRA